MKKIFLISSLAIAFIAFVYLTSPIGKLTTGDALSKYNSLSGESTVASSKKDFASRVQKVYVLNEYGEYVLSTGGSGFTGGDQLDLITPGVPNIPGSPNIPSGGVTAQSFLNMADTVFKAWRAAGFEYTYGGKMQFNGEEVRIDCSGYLTYVMYKLGMIGKSATYTSDSFLNNTMNFTVIDSWDKMQPGDIVAWTGHVAIYAGNNSWYSWGSDTSAMTKPIPDPTYHDYAKRKYNNSAKKIILRIGE